MKKLLSLLLVMIMLPIAALANSIDLTTMFDFSTMTDDALKNIISLCSAELRSRASSDPEGVLLFEYDKIRLYQTGDPYINYGILYIPVVICNDGDYEAFVSPDNTICNGWSIYSSGCSTLANSKKKDAISFKIEDAEVTSVDQITSLLFVWNIFDMGTFNTTYQDEQPTEHRFW